MKYSFFQRMRLWLPSAEIQGKKQKGTLTLLAAFLFIIFSVLGMGMIYVSQVYLKISGYKLNAVLLDFASENGIKHGFNELSKAFAALPNPCLLSETEMEILRLDMPPEGTEMIDKFNGNAPTILASTWEKMSWESRNHWTFDHMDQKDTYFMAGFIISIQSQGKLENFRPTKVASLEMELTAAAGNLPLAQFPFLVDQNLGSESMTEFRQENPIELYLPASNSIPPRILTTEEPILPRSAAPYLEKALNIKLFQPESLTSAQLREALGLAVSNDPVPEGVYLVQGDSGLGGIFVQGDCNEMILAIEGENQVISFKQGEFEWILRFSPSQKKTEFLTPQGILKFDQIPLGLILVNGAVHSLGGGYVNSSGTVEIILDREIPCLLDGVNLTLVCSDEIILSSHLILQGVKWQEGIPYVKDSKAMLNIFTSGKDLIDGTERKGRIAVDEKAPQELKIEASLTASGQGFSIEGENKTVHLLGSLQTSDYTSSGNALKVRWDERFLDQDELLAHNPRSVKPVLSILYLQASLWNNEPNTIDNE
jgi:hypothetical protein